MGWEDDPVRQLRILRMAAIMPLADAIRAADLDPLDDRREIARINTRLRERDLGIRSRGETLTGAEALRMLNGGRITGDAALDVLNHQDELDRRSMDWELVEAYSEALGLPITGVDFRRGMP